MAGTFILLCTLCVSAKVVEMKYTKHTFADPDNPGYFSHLVINKENGKLFVGAVNKIYQLSRSLTKEITVETGPKLDNPKCLGRLSDCPYVREETESYSKALVIDHYNKRLISCSNLYLGICYKRHLSNISKSDPIPERLVPVVPNDESSTCIMFIANGPQNRQALYVAATRSTEGLEAYRDLVPAVSTRKITTFEYAVKTIEYKSLKEMEAQQRDVFRVDYIYGFSSKGFNYFLTVQKESTDLGENVKYVTRIVRICQQDSKYYSYTEVPLECSFKDQAYNLVQAATVSKVGDDLSQGLSIKPHDEDALFVVFSKSVKYSKTPTKDSALCVYSIRKLETLFTRNIQACFKGIGNVGPAHFVPREPCRKSNYTIQDNYCGSHEFNTPVEGTMAITADGVWQHDSVASAIAVTLTYKYTVASIGTSDGIIHKVVVESESSATEYENFTVVSGSKVKAIQPSLSAAQIYILTDKQVILADLHKCDRFKTCQECKAAQDPYCGWCTLENRCTTRTKCPNYEQNRRWLSYPYTTEENCTQIYSIHPNKTQLVMRSTTKLQIKVLNFPWVSGQNYKCAFVKDDFKAETAATLRPASDPNGERIVECNTPPTNTLPKIPTGSDKIEVMLFIRVQGKNFVSKSFVFYDCHVHNSCTSCTTSQYPCIWCLRRHRCVANEDQCNSNTTLIKANVTAQGAFCPKIRRDSSQILVPSGTSHKVSVRAENLQSFQTHFRCEFLIEGIKRTIQATAVGDDRIECQSFKFMYKADSEILNVPFRILWSQEKARRDKDLDNPSNIQVKMYKCQQMADSCGECLTINSTFNCGWCTLGDKSCSIEPECQEQTNWLRRTAPCPNPEITKISPLTGPVLGGTNLTIEGVNLGKAFSDIQHNVTVAGIPCIPIKELYKKSTRIVCETQASSGLKSGNVQVVVNKMPNLRTFSVETFQYVRPYVTGLTPKKGPESGGTTVTLHGQHLDAGTSVSVRVNNSPCMILGKSTNEVVFKTPMTSQESGARRRRETGSKEIHVMIDKAPVIMQDGGMPKFLYLPDPTVTFVEPQMGIFRGGISNTVTGTNFDAVQHPRMLVSILDQEFTSPCSVTSSTEMVCHSPDISPINASIVSGEALQKNYGFIMDGVMKLRNLTGVDSQGNPFVFEFYRNPVFEPFGVMRFTQGTGSHLTLTGKNLHSALKKKKVPTATLR